MAVGRFAPSPTGALHVGNLRTALLAWLFARSAGSRFLLRVEDLDPSASSHEHEADQRFDLTALGLDWDPPVVHQSERRPEHEAAIEDLVAADRTFLCYCSRREVREASLAPHGTPGTYPGTCRDLSAAGRRQFERDGRPAALRLRADRDPVTIVDRVHGEVTRASDDIVLRRNDGVPAYHVAVVVDDDDAGVEEVVRADDLLDVTPSQAHLLDLLGRRRPGWAHVPLVLGPDGQRLAKRHGAVTLADLAAQGVAAEEVLSRLAASLGLCHRRESVGTTALVGRFDPDRLPTEPWVWG